jgi:hypothetical protein
MTPDELAARTKRRIANLSDREEMEWLDAALSGVQRHLDEYRKTGEVAHLGEMIIAETPIAAVLDDMVKRHEARRQEGLA